MWPVKFGWYGPSKSLLITYSFFIFNIQFPVYYLVLKHSNLTLEYFNYTRKGSFPFSPLCLHSNLLGVDPGFSFYECHIGMEFYPLLSRFWWLIWLEADPFTIFMIELCNQLWCLSYYYNIMNVSITIWNDFFNDKTMTVIRQPRSAMYFLFDCKLIYTYESLVQTIMVS